MRIRKTIFGRTKIKPNTFIGGCAGYITSAASFANNSLLTWPASTSFPVSRIKYFKIVGSDIELYIEGAYTLKSYSQFSSNSNTLTYYDDRDGNLKQIGTTANTCFRMQSNCRFLNIKGVINWISGQDQFTGYISQALELPNLVRFAVNSSIRLPAGKIWYMPICNVIGNPATRDIITGFSNTTRFYVHPDLQTANAGGVEGDMAAAITAGSIVRYVTNFNAPIAISNLSAGTITSTTVQLNFSPPSSLNVIDFYEVYVNGVFRQTIATSGSNITGLVASTIYQITVQAVDIFYNKSANSNYITVATS